MKRSFILAVLVAGLYSRAFGQSEIISNGGFEFGLNGWLPAGAIVNATTNPVHSGTASMSITSVAGSEEIFQNVTIPPDTIQATLTYYYNIYSVDGSSTANAQLAVYLGNRFTSRPFVLVDSKYNTDRDTVAGQFHPVSFDVTPYIGTNAGALQLQFFVNANTTGGTQFNIDDVSLQVVNASARGPNDSFANATSLSGDLVQVTATNTYSTKETGEPRHAGNAGGKSLWWRWTAPNWGMVTITTSGSSFDTLLAAYTGSNVSTLTNVAANDNENDSTATSRIRFPVAPGTEYKIAVDGKDGAAGVVLLSLSFAQDELLPAKGLYSGLFAETNNLTTTNAGFFSATVAAQGKFSAKLLMAGRSYSLSGSFDTNGTYARSFSGPGGTRLTAQLHLGLSGEDAILGTVSSDAWSAPLRANKAVYSRTSPAPLGGKKYTLAIQSAAADVSQPAGYGFGAVSVDVAGNVKFSGTLGDGTKVAQKTFLSKQGEWPLYLSATAGKEIMQGWLVFTNTPESDFNGTVSWMKQAQRAKLYPNGFAFTNGVEVVGSLYSFTKGMPVLNLPSGVVLLQLGNPPGDFTTPFTLDAKNKLLSTNKLSLTLSTATGLFKGSVPSPVSTKPLAVSGALLQKQNAGFGCFLGLSQTGPVTLESPEQ